MCCYGYEKGFNEVATITTSNSLQVVNPATNKAPALGFHLRQDWAEMVQIPPSGGLEEFDRKWVHNDYALLALWEMSVKSLRIPFADIMNIKRRQRLCDVTQLGFELNYFRLAFLKKLLKVIWRKFYRH